MAEDTHHQKAVQNITRSLIKQGIKSDQISISGIQNPGLETWALKKGIIFNRNQEVDIIHSEN